MSSRSMPELQAIDRRRHPRRRRGFGLEEKATKNLEISGKQVQTGTDAESDTGPKKKRKTKLQRLIRQFDPEEGLLYDCAICFDQYLINQGVVTCAEHFLCNDCIGDIFTDALDPLSSIFPVKCCPKGHDSKRPAYLYRERLVQHLLPANVNEAYARKELEYETLPTLKIYCAKCKAFIPPQGFVTQGPYTIATCDCGTVMCVGCKGTWQDNHRCIDSNNPEARPEWLPEYSKTFRIKKCPGCQMYIELKEACNHMTCQYCHHEFCFICLIPWGRHDEGDNYDLCPATGEPEFGYDKDGYENSLRAIHRDTGLNRKGLNRLGEKPEAVRVAHLRGNGWNPNEYADFQVHDDEDLDPPLVRPLDPPRGRPGFVGGPPLPPPPDEEAERISRLSPEELALYEYRNQLDETVDDLRMDQYYRKDTSPYHDTLGFDQLDCRHHLEHRTGQNDCQFCGWFMPYFYNQCRKCQVSACRWCSASWLHNPDREYSNYVSVIQHAEVGEAPYKAKRRSLYRSLQEAGMVPVWRAADMFEEHEKLLLETDPFYYGEYGISEMFAEAGRELSHRQWYTWVENVGIAGNDMAFDLFANRFAPLCWDEIDREYALTL